jgi:hypothetical protein
MSDGKGWSTQHESGGDRTGIEGTETMIGGGSGN